MLSVYVRFDMPSCKFNQRILLMYQLYGVVFKIKMYWGKKNTFPSVYDVLVILMLLLRHVFYFCILMHLVLCLFFTLSTEDEL